MYMIDSGVCTGCAKGYNVCGGGGGGGGTCSYGGINWPTSIVHAYGVHV